MQETKSIAQVEHMLRSDARAALQAAREVLDSAGEDTGSVTY